MSMDVSPGDLPKAKVRKRRLRFSLVWIVPIVAALLATYLVYNRVRYFGQTITIHFLDADGLKPGQTPLRYRGVVVGEVSDIRLGKNQRSAEVKVKLRRMASTVAREGSTFWIVRPQVGLGNITGLGTIISGPHITVVPGRGEPTSDFIGTEFSADVIDPHGLHIVLLANEAGSLRSGIPIYYRGIEVGAVRETRLSTNARTVEIHAVIRKRYAPLVRAESKFWNVTGMDVRFGLFRGAEINVESLKSLVVGGIAFATPANESEPVPDGMYFQLHDKMLEEWRSWAPSIALSPEDADAIGRHAQPSVPRQSK